MTTSGRQLRRLLDIDALLRSGRRQTSVSIAAVLEVTDRTIRNDLDMMRDQFDAPIEYTKAKGTHYTDANWRLPSIPLSKGELFALTLGAQMLGVYAGSVYQEELQSAIAQLAQRLPVPVEVDLQKLVEENVVFRASGELALDPAVWKSLEEACTKRRRVWMRYGTPGQEVSERELDPYVLHFLRNNPYVTGWCHQRDAVRDFRVDRIRELKLLAERFEVSPSFDRRAHFTRAFQHEVGGEARAVVIWFDGRVAAYIRERRWHESQRLEEHPDGAVTLRMEVPGLGEVKRWVMYYGAAARVLGPPELVEMVRAEVDGMKQFYQEDGE
jgi:predicted DNA-binding transcriptional regulator YafY